MRETPHESEIVVALPEDAAWLGFEETVPRTLVHKRAVSEVLITDSRVLDQDTVLCAAELPPLHRLHGPRHHHHDLLGIAEATRQAAELLAHRHLGVPPGRLFIFRNINLRALECAALRVEESPARLILQIHVTNRRELGGKLASFDLSGTLHLNGRPAATGCGSCLFVAPKDYASLRSGKAGATPSDGFLAKNSEPSRANPALAGRDCRDVVLGPPHPRGEETEAALAIDETHPSFFDHPHDHVPGPLLLEGMRQLALARACMLTSGEASDWVLTRCAVTFERFAELDRQVLLIAAGGESETGFEFSVHIDQDGSVAHGAMAVERV